MERVLVTGAAGFVGSILCEHLLDAGYRVVALDNLAHGQRSLLHLCADPRFDFVFGDARDGGTLREHLAKADVVVPLAAVVGAPACDENPELARSLNFGAIQTLEGLRSQNQLVVYPTTNSGYGTQSGEVYCTEDTPLEPISLYGRTKVDAEKLLLDSGTAITLRLATLYGLSPRPRLDLMVHHFVWMAMTEGSITLFEKDFKRNFVHIRDAADCFVHALAHRDAMIGRAFNLGRDEENMSKWDLAMRVKAHFPNFYVHAAEYGTDRDKRNYVVSNQRLREAGFVARRGLDEAIEELRKGFAMLKRSDLRNV